MLLSKNEADYLARQQWHDDSPNTRLPHNGALPRERLSPLADSVSRWLSQEAAFRIVRADGQGRLSARSANW